jgi:hypothetical protein
MTKKHFIAFAEYLKDTAGYCEPFSTKQLEHLANFCHSQNSNFNEDRWLGYIAGTNGNNGGKV